jgi:hypothetical protein
MSDNIIQFPGGQDDDTQAEKPVFWDALSDDQRKAIEIVLSGMSFVTIGIKPTGSGADFFTAIHGAADELTAAQPHLGGVLDRAFARKDLH